MLKLLRRARRPASTIRVLGKVGKSATGIEARKLPGLRLHVRAIVRDGTAAFVGSQSLRKLELDGRREVGVIVSDTAGRQADAAEVFEGDWERQTKAACEAARPSGGSRSSQRQRTRQGEDKPSKACRPAQRRDSAGYSACAAG